MCASESELAQHPYVLTQRKSSETTLLSTDLPFARRMGVKPIKRSVLYQKMNLLPKNKDGSTPLMTAAFLGEG